jgi:flavorubredoxin
MLEKVCEPSKVLGLVISHQDPDIAGGLPEWLDYLQNTLIISSSRAHVLLDYYTHKNYRFHDVSKSPRLEFPSGNYIEFVSSPFMHFPNAFTSYDSKSKFLFSSDVWAAVDINWRLVINDFNYHQLKLDLFNTDYMACNRATRNFIKRLDGYTIDAICPQHGSIIPKQFVSDALSYMSELECGLDLIYPV